MSMKIIVAKSFFPSLLQSSELNLFVLGLRVVTDAQEPPRGVTRLREATARGELWEERGNMSGPCVPLIVYRQGSV